jgi:hypothetical protein
MLVSLRDKIGMAIHAKDGEIGKVVDFYLDDREWIIRYMIGKTGFWLLGRHVMIPSAMIEQKDWGNKSFNVSLSRRQIEESPLLDIDKMLARNTDRQSAQPIDGKAVFGYAGYSGTDPFTKYSAVPFIITETTKRSIVADEESEGCSLQSAASLFGYEISTNDGILGYVEDFILHEQDWSIRFMIIDTRKGPGSKKILIAPEWIDWISWRQKKVSVSLDKEKIGACPDFDMGLPLSDEVEKSLIDYFECR